MVIFNSYFDITRGYRFFSHPFWVSSTGTEPRHRGETVAMASRLVSSEETFRSELRAALGESDAADAAGKRVIPVSKWWGILGEITLWLCQNSY